MKKNLLSMLLIIFILFFFSPSVFCVSKITGSKHDLGKDLGDGGGGDGNICLYCHTPHNGNIDGDAAKGPLWNRYVTTETFTVYSSATIDSNGGTIPQPGGVSKLCLSCHDGVNGTATHNTHTGSTKHDLIVGANGEVPDSSSAPSCTRCHDTLWGPDPGQFVIGTDLTNDHPISMTYPTVSQDDKFNVPPDLQSGWGGGDPNFVKLRDGKVECISCHNVHDPGDENPSVNTSPFLRTSMNESQLCLVCHIK